MNLKQDILEKIEHDFSTEKIKVLDLLQRAITNADYLNNDRIIRCIIFLSEKNIEKVQQFIEVATNDPRDVMLLAEYINRGNDEIPKRIRDFNKIFEECETNVRE